MNTVVAIILGTTGVGGTLTIPDQTVVLNEKSRWRFTLASCHDSPPPDLKRSHGNAGSKTFDWNLVSSRNPDALIWGGDIIYGDFPLEASYLPPPINFIFPSLPISITPFVPTPGEKLRRMYTALKNDSGYTSLLQLISGRHLGSWDDHDYGVNDGDRTMPEKNVSKEAFLEFFDAAVDDPRRERGGIYYSTLFASTDDLTTGHSVLVIALDLRWFRDPYSQVDGDFLGEEQWTWLESTLEHSKADAHIFVSSIQFLVEGRELVSECWNDFPDSRKRFLQVLLKSQVKAPLIFSGDVHFAEIMKASCSGGGTLVEVTTSGLTHSWSRNGMGHRKNDVNSALNAVMLLLQFAFPWRYQTRSASSPDGGSMPWWHPRTFLERDFFLSENFGELEFVWAGTKPSMVARVLSAATGDPVIEKTFFLADLHMVEEKTCARDDARNEFEACSSLTSSLSRLCAPHRGEPSWLRRAMGIAILVFGALLLFFLKPAAFFFVLWRLAVFLRRLRLRPGGTGHGSGVPPS